MECTDLFATTNLGLTEPGLNVTTWLPVLRTEPGQTNLLVGDLTANECFFILGTTNDTDTDGLTDAFEKLVSHTDPANSDQNTNGIPDGWEWAHFGSLQPGSSDYDGDLVSNYDEYLRGSDPNTIRFFISLTNLYVNGLAQLELNLEAGVPASVAVLVDNTNLAAASWTTYGSSNLTVNLGSVEGWHQVRVGLRGRLDASEQTWERRRIKLDLTLPSLAVTNPTSSVLSQPLIQLKGYSPEPLQSITYDLANAGGQITNQQVLLLDQYCDTNLWEVTTNYYQAFDLALTNGINSITLHATDLAGNTTVTNFSFTLDYSNDTNPPAISLYWPRDGMQVSGSNITWRGFVDDATAVVTVSVTDANGVTNSANAIVEREGKVWAEDLLLSDGTNLLTLTATDAARNVAATNITVVNLLGALTIDPVSEYQLTNATLELVSGTISLNDYTVWVNGTRATQTNGTWRAWNVPLGPGGTAEIQAIAIPNSDNGGNGSGGSGGGGGNGQNPNSPEGISAAWDGERGSFIYLASFQGQFNSTWSSSDDCGPGQGVCRQTTNYRSPVDSVDCGQGSFRYDEWGDTCVYGRVTEWYHYDYVWPRDSMQVTEFDSYYYADAYKSYSTNGSQVVSGNDALQDIPPGRRMDPFQWQEDESGGDGTTSYEFSRSVTSRLKMRTGGNNVGGRKSLFKMRGSATAWRKAFIPDPDGGHTEWVGTDVPAPLPIGRLASDGYYYAALPDGERPLVTPRVSSDTAKLDATKNKFVLRIRQDETVINDKIQNAIVGQAINLNCRLVSEDGSNPPLQISSYKWTVSGYAVAGYSPSLNSAAVDENIVTTNSIVQFYWVTGGRKEVRCEVIVEGEKLNAKTRFDVIRPEVTWTLTPKDQVAVDTNYADGGGFYHLRTGKNYTTNDVGMLYEFKSTDGYSYGYNWRFEFIQVATIDWKINLDFGTPGANFSKWVVMRVLDCRPSSPYYYERWFLRNGFIEDTPADKLEDMYVFDWRRDNFECYLMFKPEGGISVPLRMATWNWYGRANRFDTNSSPARFNGIPPFIHPQPVTGSDCQTFPQWTNHWTSIWTNWHWRTEWFPMP